MKPRTDDERDELAIGIMRSDIDLALRDAVTASILCDVEKETECYRRADEIQHAIWHRETLMEWRKDIAAGWPQG